MVVCCYKCACGKYFVRDAKALDHICECGNRSVLHISTVRPDVILERLLNGGSVIGDLKEYET